MALRHDGNPKNRKNDYLQRLHAESLGGSGGIESLLHLDKKPAQ